MGMRLKNGTGKVINGCTVSFAVEQFSSTTSGKSDTTVTFATQINAASLKTGTWVSRGVYSPTITSASYANLNGASSANRTIQTVVLSGLNIGPNDDLWVRWTVFSTSSEPLAMAIDDLTINSMVLVNNPQTISFDLSKNNLTYGDLAPVVTASSTSALPVTVTSSATGVVAVGANNLLSIVGAGTAVLTASQAGDGTWAAATPIQRTVQVNPASQNITFALNSATAKVGDPNRLLIATSDADLPVALSSSNPNVAVVNGYTLSIVGPGTATITATQAGNSNFLAALPVEQILNVSLVGPSFVGEFGGASATSDEDRDGISALVEYGLGGSPQSNDSGKLPQPTVQGGYLMMTVVERTNDSTLVIRPESSASVTFPVLGATPIRSVSVNQDGVPVGFARVTYSIPIAGNPTQFMRLRFEVSP
jgi:hypothetical protein